MFLFLFSSTVSCTTNQSRFSHLGQPYPARSENCSIDVYTTGNPDKEYITISRLDVHLEKTHLIQFIQPGDFEEALTELKKQACLSGADAIIHVRERFSRFIEAQIYHVTAIGIKYK